MDRPCKFAIYLLKVAKANTNQSKQIVNHNN